MAEVGSEGRNTEFWKNLISLSITVYTRVFPKVADASSADSFQWQITLRSSRIVSVSDFWKNLTVAIF